jgi:DNA-binding CsgD family transcriptional regulator
MRGALTMSDPRRLCEFEADVKATRAAADSNRSGARAARALLWDWDSRQGAPARAVLARLDGCLHRDGEEMPAELVPNLVGALLAYELYDQAREAITDLQEWARASGSVPERALADGLHAFVQTRLGNLTTAETMLRSSIERTCELRLELTFAMISWYCADVLLERPDVADLTGLIDAARPEAFLPVQSGAMLMEARAQLRFAARQRSAAIHDMRTAGAIYDALGIKSLYGAATWRSTLAPMLDHADREEALELAQHGLEMARSVSQPRPIGVGLRVLGTLEQNCGRLSEAAAVLASLSAPLEHARALVELGAALRRQGQRAAAREPLRRGLDLATRCGAVRLAECARTELIATGARPRRDYATGRDALTPSERRVAEMAAQGLSSEAIAHELVVTTRTVDSHLSRAYRKLGIHSRKALADALKTAE